MSTTQQAKVYTPAFKVTIWKRITRFQGGSARFQYSRQDLDLTPMLGDGCVITTSKDIRMPEGNWNITLTDQPDLRIGAALDSLYGIVEPMDYIEIRMARSPERYRSGLPAVMRGFVSNVRRTKTFDNNGAPIRHVIVSGKDYGKVGQMARIFLRADYATGNDYLTAFRLFARNGISPAPVTPDQFMETCLGLLNGWIEALGDSSVQGKAVQVLQGAFSVNNSRGGLVSLLAAQLHDDTVWSLMQSFADSPWNELFIEDQDLQLGDPHDGPVLVYRPSPLVGIRGGAPIMGGVVPRMALDITESDVVSSDYGRSDAGVYNYFWVDPTYSQPTVNTQEFLGIDALASGSVVDQNYPNNNPLLYGLRLCNLRTSQFGSGGYKIYPVNNGEIAQYKQAQVNWIGQRRIDARDMNRDNSAFEAGGFTVKGDERFKAGRFVLITDGGVQAQAYAYGVAHTFVPYQSFHTSLTIDRGTNFAVRVGTQASPYFAEGTQDSYGS